MSIDESNVVDFILPDAEHGSAMVLVVSDHREWTGDDSEHLQLLQEKLNAYLRFVGSGEIFDQYPAARYKPIIFEIVGKYSLNRRAKEFLLHAGHIIKKAGFSLRHRLLESQEP